MAFILICASPSPGHVNPLLIIAGHLAQRGHDVTFASASRFRRAVEHASLRFEPLIGAANYNYDEINVTYPELGKATTGIDRLNGFVQYLMAEQIIVRLYRARSALCLRCLPAIDREMRAPASWMHRGGRPRT